MNPNPAASRFPMKTLPSILVTGAPRTGTTLLGEMLGQPRSVGVLFEPFHPDVGVNGLDADVFDKDRERTPGKPLRVEFPFVTDEHPFAASFQRLLADVIAGRASYKRPSYPGRHGWLTALARSFVKSRLALRNRLAVALPYHTRWVVKDPHLCLASEFAHRALGMACLVTIRHPAATVESWKRLGWNPDLRQFWRQPLLWETHLQSLPRAEPERLSPLERAAYVWLYINKTLLDFRDRNPDMVFLRLEDMALRPGEIFRGLYERFGLPFDAAVERAVLAHTAAGSDAAGTREQPHRLKRDSHSVVAGWKARLSSGEQHAIREIVGETGGAFYPDEAW